VNTLLAVRVAVILGGSQGFWGAESEAERETWQGIGSLRHQDLDCDA
jgi:hypothetical protein